MKTLQAYLDQKNKWSAIFNGPQYEIATADGRKRLAQSIDAELSPENLTCDGELPRSQVQARYKMLTTAARELVALDPTVQQYIYELV